MRAFFMKLFASKASSLILRLSTNQNWPLSIKFNMTKTICFLKKTCTRFFKGYHKEHVSKSIEQKSITILSFGHESQIRTYFLNTFPAKICAMPFTMSFDIYLKWKLDYSIFILHIQFFLDSLKVQVNQENYTEGCL